MTPSKSRLRLWYRRADTMRRKAAALASEIAEFAKGDDVLITIANDAMLDCDQLALALEADLS